MVLLIQHLDGSSEKYNINDINDLREFLKSFSIPLYIIRGAQSLEEALSLIATHLSRHYSTAYVLKNDDILSNKLEIKKEEKEEEELFGSVVAPPGSYLKEAHTPKYDKIVDHTFHAKRSKRLPKEYNQLFSQARPLFPARNFLRRISKRHPKLEYDLSEYLPESSNPLRQPVRVIVKPYHRRLYSEDWSVINKPIHGWSAMATHALYNAAGIGHLTDEMFMKTHKGIPLIIHKLPHTYNKLLSDYNQPRALVYQFGRDKPKPIRVGHINPLHLQQIAIMDYLTNNFRRSQHDILVNPTPEESGPHKGLNSVLATNHEAAFQYTHAPTISGDIFVPADSPAIYFHRLLPKAPQVIGQEPPSEELATWWRQHSASVLNTLYDQLKGIKSGRIRRHIINNFKHRWNVVNEWTTDGKPYNYQQISIFDKLRPYELSMVPMEPYKNLQRDAQYIRKRLPQNPYEAANILAEKVLDIPGATRLSTAVLTQLLKEMPHNDFSRFLSKYYRHPIIDIPKAVKQGILEVEPLDINKVRALHDSLGAVQALGFSVWDWLAHKWAERYPPSHGRY